MGTAPGGKRDSEKERKKTEREKKKIACKGSTSGFEKEKKSECFKNTTPENRFWLMGKRLKE